MAKMSPSSSNRRPTPSPSTREAPESTAAADEDDDADPSAVRARLQRLEHENAELCRKTTSLVDYVRRTAHDPEAAADDSDSDDSDAAGPPPLREGRRGCLPEPAGFDGFAAAGGWRCQWDAFGEGVAGAFSGGGALGEGD